MILNRRPQQFFAIIATSLFLFSATSTLAEQPPGSDKTEAAKQLFTQGQEAGKSGDYQKAVTLLREADALVPNPIARYQIAQYLVHFDKKKAVEEFKWYINNGDPKTTEFKLAHQSLLILIVPELSRDQQKLFELADDNFQAASIAGDKRDGPLNTSIEIFEKLHKEKPDYFPVLLRLGAAYETRKSYADAARCYDAYLSAFVKFGFDPSDLREIRRQKIACAALASEANDAKTVETMPPADELKKLIVEKCLVTLQDDVVPDHCSFIAHDEVSFEADSLITVRHYQSWQVQLQNGQLISRVRASEFHSHHHVKLKDLNPARLVPQKSDPNNWFIIIETSNSKPAISQTTKHVFPKAAVDPETKHVKFVLSIKDERSANQVSRALKELIQQAGGKPELFEDPQ